ncbi:DMT family transporter [Pseudomonas matsuisoli]|uniref:Multidrug resistance protein n=1 Tax=Pseudomonas matsuisoli TaxID=1515666 RepID=A0A917Q343_9PSED|nr:SMR family transporter [Pseudomonas matsuisoli]GGK09350.1 multidrug resistance protein [Pseudomonas matsuisoli]
MPAYLLLAVAILAEVIATTSLKAVEGLSKPLPLVLAIVGYAVSFSLLTIVVKVIPVGIAYAIWAGLGIVLVSIVAAVIYQQRPDLPAMLGMLLIVGGVVVIQLFSRTTGH